VIKKKLEEYKNNEPNLYYYSKAFYWTLSNYIDACRVSSTNMVAVNTEEAQAPVEKSKIELNLTKAAINVGKKIAESLPFVGGVISEVCKVVDSFNEKVKNKGY
jgi:hypothetical protein